MQREGVIQQIFEATFPAGTTSAEFIDSFQRPTEALIRNYFNESFRIIGNVPVSGEVRPTTLIASTIIPSAELSQPLLGDSISYITSLLDDFIREQLAPISNIVFGNPTVSGVSVTKSGNDLALEVVVIASSGTAYDSAVALPPQFYDPSGIPAPTNINAGISLEFTTLSGVEFVMQHDLNTPKFLWDIWTTDTTPDCIIYPENIVASGINHVTIQLDTPINGFVNLIGITV